jgi:hypothetical protein
VVAAHRTVRAAIRRRRPGITLEIAVAQGFKHAANRRPAHAGARHETRMHLAERALEMLKGTEYWFPS